MIRLVAFDGDNTLWDFDEAMRLALRSVLEELWTNHSGPGVNTLTVERMVAIRDRVAGELEGRVSDLAVVRHAAFERTLEEIGAPDPALAARLNAMFFAAKAGHHRPFPDTIPVLTNLTGRYRLALLTNGNTDPAQYGLETLLDPVVHAAAEGFAKPDPKIFEILLARAGCESGEAAYVGDSLEHDVAGARRAGMKAIWLNRVGASNQSEITPDAEIRSLFELGAVLDSWD